MNSAVQKVTADIASLKSLERPLKASGEMNEPVLQILQQKLPPLIKLHGSAKETIAKVNHSQKKLRDLVKGHKKTSIILKLN